jgi:hypothetical protein
MDSGFLEIDTGRANAPGGKDRLELAAGEVYFPVCRSPKKPP